MLEDTTPEELEQTVKEIDIRVKDKEAQLQKLLISLQKTKKEVIDNFESVQHTYLQNFKLPPTSTQPNNQKFEIPSEEDLNLAKSAYQNANQDIKALDTYITNTSDKAKRTIEGYFIYQTAIQSTLSQNSEKIVPTDEVSDPSSKARKGLASRFKS